jgi:hypothetical protein
MELLIPSLLLLLAGGFIVFGLFPKLGPTTLIGLAVVSLILVVQHHITRNVPLKHSLSPMSIPELMLSFDSLNNAVDTIVRSKNTMPQQVKDFQAAWSRIFGRPVEAPAAEAYLQVNASGRKGTYESLMAWILA